MMLSSSPLDISLISCPLVLSIIGGGGPRPAAVIAGRGARPRVLSFFALWILKLPAALPGGPALRSKLLETRRKKKTENKIENKIAAHLRAGHFSQA